MKQMEKKKTSSKESRKQNKEKIAYLCFVFSMLNILQNANFAKVKKKDWFILTILRLPSVISAL